MSVDLVRLGAYAVLFGLALRAANSTERSAPERRLLIAVGVFGIVLGLAALIEFGSALAETGRHLARDEGWYASRRRIQAIAVLAVPAVALLGLVVASRFTGRLSPPCRWLLTTFVGLVAFVVVRTISLHQVDAYLYAESPVPGWHPGELLELLGIAVVGMQLWLLAAPQGKAIPPERA